ncbi:uncharacterized protein LOC104847804 [Fukomys damarensis]|uniref:uncharacterized protein LOC104847804 n=1 Tax=Fukomys damarensis TaxID=885580 RepID=UPI0005401ADC|nr:uncharacterized protein LOC104847804 [Fukomys damarensis]
MRTTTTTATGSAAGEEPSNPLEFVSSLISPVLDTEEDAHPVNPGLRLLGGVTVYLLSCPDSLGLETIVRLQCFGRRPCKQRRGPVLTVATGALLSAAVCASGPHRKGLSIKRSVHPTNCRNNILDPSCQLPTSPVTPPTSNRKLPYVHRNSCPFSVLISRCCLVDWVPAYPHFLGISLSPASLQAEFTVHLCRNGRTSSRLSPPRPSEAQQNYFSRNKNSLTLYN